MNPIHDIPCEYGKRPGFCSDEETCCENGGHKAVYEPHCRSGVCQWWIPNHIRYKMFLIQERKEENHDPAMTQKSPGHGL